MASQDKLVEALRFVRDIATEEPSYAMVGTGAEVALRHIKRKAEEALKGIEGGRATPCRAVGARGLRHAARL
jgi:hypothetical protein